MASTVTLVGGASAVLLDAWGAGQAVDSPATLLGLAACGYAVGAWVGTTWSATAVAVSAALLTLAGQRVSPEEYHPLDDLVFYLVIVGGPALAGATLTARRRQLRDLADLTTRLRVQRAADLEAARLEEHNRVALELHRDVSEQLAAVALRVESAMRSASSSAVRSALAEVEGAARRSLDQLREALGTLRQSVTPEDPPVRTPSRTEHVDRGDVALTAACALALTVEWLVTVPAVERPWLTLLTAVALCAPLAFRRLSPLAAATTMMVLATLVSHRVMPLTAMVSAMPPLLLMAYAVGAHSRRRWPLGAAVVVAGVIAMTLLGTDPARSREGDGLVPTVVCVLLALGTGRVASGGNARTQALQRGLAELRRGREVELALARAEQRAQLARELHDTVAHSMTVVCLQAAAAQRAERPEALAVIHEAARQGLHELREGLSAMEVGRPDAESFCTAIRSEAVVLGLVPSVTADVDALDPATWALLVRAAREGLVNAGRYAPDAHVQVRLVGREAAVELSIQDDGGTAGPAFPHGSGTGLATLAGQFGAAGGHLQWGRDASGFALRATVPRRSTVPL